MCVVPLDAGLVICIELELFFGLPIPLQVGVDLILQRIDGGALVRLEGFSCSV